MVETTNGKSIGFLFLFLCFPFCFLFFPFFPSLYFSIFFFLLFYFEFLSFFFVDFLKYYSFNKIEIKILQFFFLRIQLSNQVKKFQIQDFFVESLNFRVTTILRVQKILAYEQTQNFRSFYVHRGQKTATFYHSRHLC